MDFMRTLEFSYGQRFPVNGYARDSEWLAACMAQTLQHASSRDVPNSPDERARDL
jgi:hypothetical protein